MSLVSFLRENARWLAAGALLSFLSSFGQTFFISIFAGEIRAEFGLSHGQWGGIYTLGTSVSAAVMVWAGGLTDRYRSVSLGTIVLLALALACLFMASNPAVWLLPAVIFALRFTGQGMVSHIAVVSMSRWFIATRGRALSVAGLGFAGAEALLPLIFVTLMIFVPWRGLWIMSAGIVLLGIVALRILLREERTPQSHAESSVSLGMQARHWTRGETLRHWLFWFMVPALLGPAAFNTAFFFHQVHFATLKGWSHLELVALFPLYTVLAVAAMVGSGWMLDKFGTPRVIPWFQLPIVVAFVLFSQATTLPIAAIGMVFLAVTTGANTTLPNAFWAEFYGTRHLGAIKAMAAAVMVLGSALGPGITGVLIDKGIGLETQYLGVAVYFLFATAMMVIGVGWARHLLTV
ncbi:MFS transporter [Mesobacterium sp. TK19101]|uniref:MFS transporter n=1 Tax=Mesobacterium hydrothermale TaxID=3111907 RepID=A0ABU6HGC4_9RHOB|nr:MFS transporter [Mesobacterium sp. TK19101]MEC3861356.1 MFS transporter [Mesobacterium sp. TK19101]